MVSYVWDEWDEVDRWEDNPVYTPIRQNIKNVSHPLFNPELIWDFINQKKIWVNRALLEIPIKEMDKSYLFNVLKWLDKNYAEIQFTLVYAKKLGKFPVNAGEYDEYRPLDEYPLFEKMDKRYLKLNGVKPNDTSTGNVTVI